MNLVLVIDTGQIYADWHIVKELAAQQFKRRVEFLIGKYKPTHTICAFDSQPPTFRHGLCDKYKADRDHNEEVHEQLSLAADLMTASGVTCFGVEYFEADDIIATIADKSVSAGCRVIIYSRDKDCNQLLREGKVTILKKYGQDGPEWFSTATLLEKFNLTPEQFLEYQMIVGDTTDGIVGVEGIGDKGAREMLYGGMSLRDILENPWAVKLTPKKRDALIAFSDRYELVRELVTLRTDVPLDWSPH